MEELSHRLGERLGKGRSAEVFRGTLIATGQDVAIKRFTEEWSTDARFSKRLVQEVKIASGLDHENIASLLGSGRDPDGRYYIIMELVDGISLACLHDSGRIPVTPAVYIARQVLKALVYAHEEARIVHRDLSPNNVLIDWNGNVKLADFGIAKVIGTPKTTDIGAIGTPCYVSPEQAACEPVDARSDLFVAGVLLYELVTGEPPFTGTLIEVAAKLHSGQPVVSPSKLCPAVPEALSAVILKLLERDPDKRFQSARQALAALSGSDYGQADVAVLMSEYRETVRADEAALPAPAPRARRRGPRWTWLAVGAAAAVLLGFGASWLMPGNDAASSGDRVEAREVQAEPGDPQEATEASEATTEPETLAPELPDGHDTASLEEPEKPDSRRRARPRRATRANDIRL